MTQLFRLHVRGRPLTTVVRLRLLLGCAAFAGCASQVSVDESPLLRERFLAGRLAHQTQWRACELVAPPALIAKSRCGSSPKATDPGFKDLVAAARAPQRRTSLESTRVTALIDLRFHDQSQALDRSVAALEDIVRLSPDDAAALNDLAVAYLAQAERDQRLRPLLRSLETIERARAITATMPAVLFNRALILERMTLLENARDAWTQYLSVEQSPAWQADGRAHLEAVTSFMSAGIAATPTPDEVLARHGDSASTAVSALAARTPQWAREVGFALLGEWGKAVIAGDSSRAGLTLSLTRRVAAALGADTARDASLARALAAIDAHPSSSSATLALARGHAAYANGYDLYVRGQNKDAEPLFDQAEQALRSAKSPAAEWAAVSKAVVLVNDATNQTEIANRVIETATPAEPALRGKATWVLGLIELRQGGYESANRKYRDAVTLFERAGEGENLAMLANLLAEGLQLAGQSPAAETESLRSLFGLSEYRRSRFLNNPLGIVANQARAEGWHRAALAILTEVRTNEARLGRPMLAAWARSERARNFLALGVNDSARAELTEARVAISRVPKSKQRDQFEATVRLAEARLVQANDPTAARDQLLQVVSAYEASGNNTQLPNALYLAAMAARAAGDTATARRCLMQAVNGIETRRELFQNAEVRASFYETMDAVYDAMIGLEVDAGHPDEAFKYLERARAAAWATAAPPAVGIAEVQRHLTPGVSLLEYAVLTDRVIVWSITRNTRRHWTVSLSRDSITALVAQFNAESDQVSVASGGARARLFDLLVDSASSAIDTVGLIVVPDRELSTVPFAAFWNRRTSRYLIDRAPIRTLPSAAFVAASSAASRGVRQRAAASVVIVGDPAFDAAALPDVERLPGAGQEASRIAALYRQPLVLTDTAARHGSTISLLRNAAVFHFAGHAISNLDHPELSYLALAPDPTSDGLLRAREIAAMSLSNLKIVVLSGCSTLGTRATHVGTLAGLAYSFLRARAPAIVSTLWDVDDNATTPLLVAFHQHLASGMPAAEALRSAQREALQSNQAMRQAPRTWAAFVYTGP